MKIGLKMFAILAALAALPQESFACMGVCTTGNTTMVNVSVVRHASPPMYAPMPQPMPQPMQQPMPYGGYGYGYGMGGTGVAVNVGVAGGFGGRSVVRVRARVRSRCCRSFARCGFRGGRRMC